MCPNMMFSVQVFLANHLVRLEKREGFNDPDRGNLFYDICTIIDQHRPKYILLENVSNLLGHDNGDTWKVIEHKIKRI